jgi:hypothetical protein
MKNIIHIILLLAGLSLFWSCQEDEKVVLQQPESFVLNLPKYASGIYDLKNTESIEFTTSQPDYGFTAAAIYSVQISINESFSEFETLPSTYTLAKMNVPSTEIAKVLVRLLGIELENEYPSNPFPVYVRLSAKLADGSGQVFSNIITLPNVKGYYVAEPIPELYVPGSHQDWDPATAPTVYSRNLDSKYEGYVYFTEGDEFKFTTAPNFDDGRNYGDGGNGTLSTDGGNLTVSETGLYKLNVDLSAIPYTYTAVKTEWGLIGDATAGGWDTSTPMEFNPETYEWTVTVTLTPGEIKFRANNAWDINLGGDVDNLSYGGGNIAVSAGTYVITLKLGNPAVYKCTIVKQ